MSDSLTLKGAKDVRNQKGSELQLVRPLRGGDFHQIKRWWNNKGNSTVYVSCSVFKVTTADGVVNLALDTQEVSSIRIDHDGSFNFSFFNISQIDRAALFTQDFEIIEHYMFPKIAKGPVTTVVPPGAASRPTPVAPPPPVLPIGAVTIIGDATANDGDVKTYSVTVSGGATDIEYAWSSSGNALPNLGADVTAATCEFLFSTGASTIKCQITSPTATDSPVTGTLSVNTTLLFSTRVANSDLSVAVTVDDTGNGNKYQIDGVEQDSIVATVGSTIHFDLSDASLSGHPFGIYTDSTKTTPVTVGIEQEGDDLLFTPPIAGTFSYQCGSHANMGGTITVS